jgi:cytochrome P450
VVGVHALAATRSQLNFHRAEEFIPERWLPEHTSNPDSPFYSDERGASQPFGIGPRNCLGQGLAMNQLRTIMIRIIWNFDLTLDPECDNWHKQITYTLWEKPALNVHLRLRIGHSQL